MAVIGHDWLLSSFQRRERHSQFLGLVLVLFEVGLILLGFGLAVILSPGMFHGSICADRSVPILLVVFGEPWALFDCCYIGMIAVLPQGKHPAHVKGNGESVSFSKRGR